MSKVQQRKEYQETKVYRTVSPQRYNAPRGSAQELTQFDNNLDYLLNDLQSSVPKQNGGTNNNTYRETRVIRDVDHGRSNSLNRVTHLQASNPVTEYSSDDAYNYTSPDGTKNVKSVKKESYSSYTTSGGSNNVVPEKNRMQKNINQLDSLLDDLKHVKQQQAGPINNAGIDPGLIETSKSRVVMGKKTVERELHYGDTPPRADSRTRTMERSDREGSITREIEYIDEGTYGETRPIRYTPSPSTLSKQKTVTNVQTYPLEVTQTTTPEINPEILAHLDPNLLPTGNTKVTTTIKTYTYEIPGSGYSPVAVSPVPDKYVYSPNQSQTTPSKSFVYSKVDERDIVDTVVYQPPVERSLQTNVYNETTTTNRSRSPAYQRPSSPPPVNGTTIVKETTTTRNYQPGHHQQPPPVVKEITTTRNYQPGYQDPPPSGKQTYIYNETTTTRNINEGYPPPDERYIREPPRQQTYIIKETHNKTTNTNGPYPNGYPPQEPTTIIYKHDTHTTNSYPPSRQQQHPPNNTTVIYNKTETNDNYDPNSYPYPPHNRRPNEPPYDPNVNITYKYTTTSNKYPNDEAEPLIRPQPFPRDGDFPGPPKRVDELMAKIGQEPPDGPLNSGFKAHEAELFHQKKVDTLKQQQRQQEDDLQRKEKNVPATKNITGPAVYYPPGHEMFAHKEESSGGGAWRAQGAMSKESGRYKYEAESGSSMKVKSGAAMVPVCLPLCCGLPCTII